MAIIFWHHSNCFIYPMAHFFNSVLEIVRCQMTGKAVSWHLWVGTVVNLLLFIYLGILVFRKRKDKTMSNKPAIFAIGLYIAVIMAAVIVTQILKTPVIYYRYLFVVMGMYIFAVSYLLSKEDNKICIFIICAVVLTLGTMNIVEQISENYAPENGKQIEYLKENIQEGDVLVYSNIGNGSIFASNFTNYKQYFYNGANWGVEEAYKAWAPQMDTYITTDFLDELNGRVWIIDSQDNGFYNELFNTEDFKYLETIFIILL